MMDTPNQPATVPPLSAEYKRVQKVYLLNAAAIACWRLFGISIDLSKFGLVSTQGSDIAPLILLGGLVYLAYKLTVEWKENDQNRRKDAWSRRDLWVTHGIALSAVIITVQQLLLRQHISVPSASSSMWLRLPFAFLCVLATCGLFVVALAFVGRVKRGVGIVPFAAISITAIALLVYTTRLIGPLSTVSLIVLTLAPVVVILVSVGSLLTLIAVRSVAGAAKLIESDTDDNPGPSPFDVLGF